MVKKTTESKYVVVFPRICPVSLGRVAEMARRATEEKYAIDTPKETFDRQPNFL
jgi:hypothetical protein